jgi:hypothetical protein
MLGFDFAPSPAVDTTRLEREAKGGRPTCKKVVVNHRSEVVSAGLINFLIGPFIETTRLCPSDDL